MKLIRDFPPLMAVAILACMVSATALAAPQPGIAMHGEPALAPGFKSLPYANPDAPQGGTLNQAITGTFDSISPFIVKGNAAYGIQTYVFESLMGRINSSSYVPGRDDPHHAAMTLRAKEIFDAHQISGKVDFEYDTRVYYGRMS